MTTELAGATVGAAEPAQPGGPAGTAADDPRLPAWSTFLRAHARLTRRLDEELQAAHHVSLAEYDALLQLARTPGRRLRMSVLADRVLLSRSGITRLVDRLEASDMVKRSACATDARGAEAILTPTGIERLRAASETHLAGVRRYFLDVVGTDDRLAIERALDRDIDGLGAGAAADPACTTDDG
jgi:DNA-binding MarR family transcriptional regulator